MPTVPFEETYPWGDEKNILRYSLSMAAAAAVAAQTKSVQQRMHSASDAHQPYPRESDVTSIKPPIDPLLEQANVQLIIDDDKPVDPFAHLRRPIESVPTTLPTPAPPKSTAHASPFLALPTEIHLLILRHLPWPAQYALKLTNRYFHSIPELPAPIDFFHHRYRGKSFQQSLLISLCAAGIVKRGFEPCYVCWEVQGRREDRGCAGVERLPLGSAERGGGATEGCWGAEDAHRQKDSVLCGDKGGG
ncbi:hypothetical protein NA57DRAFT_59029 [Rhizodiscina lignyota]|uniref:F-box domain-containing protein n=1 Tax=Rhizodiscina lignyota TaxID=1504668 RepID=A0A9P4M2S0_9PEZI|nr:hypothetical protein NA57DRAFT_59029 [Rhizodiscina lignyota]